MARIVLANYKKTYKLIASSVGSSQCARLIQAIENAETGTCHVVGDYHGQIKVRTCEDILEGTVIATLLGNKYPNESTGNHVAIFVRKDATGITVFDQYTGKKPDEHTIRYKGGVSARIDKTERDGSVKKGVLNMSSDGDFFCVVEV